MVVNLPRNGQPSMSTNDQNIDKIKKLVLENRHMSLRELAQETNISLKSVHNIMTGILGMERITARLIPKGLNFVQKEHQKQMTKYMIFLASMDSTFMKCITTGDET